MTNDKKLISLVLGGALLAGVVFFLVTRSGTDATGPDDETAAAQSECRTVAAHMVSLLHAGQGAAAEFAEDIIVNAYTNDCVRRPKAYIECVAAAKDTGSVNSCQSKFTLTPAPSAASKAAAPEFGPKDFEAVVDGMCACKDDACRAKAQQRIGAMAPQLLRGKPDEDAREQIAKAQKRLVACLPKSDAKAKVISQAAATRNNPELSPAGELADKGCACTDRACADGVMKDLEGAFRSGALNPGTDGAELSRLGACVAKLSGK